jgi:YHS domain-containing protein
VFRAIFYLIAGVFIIGILRAVIAAVAKLFSEAFAPADESQAASRPSVPASEALHKDSVCGAFVAPSTAVQITVSGTRHYFCSAACRDKFKSQTESRAAAR